MILIYNNNKSKNKGELKKLTRKLLFSKKLAVGKNFTGQIVNFFRGGGYTKHYRKIDFFRLLWNMSALILQIERDPFRTSSIALICYQNGILSYILASEGLQVGTKVYIGYLKFKLFQNLLLFNSFKRSNCLCLKEIPEGSLIHLIEGTFFKKLSYVRAAGTSAKLLRHLENLVIVRFPSKELYLFYGSTIASIGQLSNGDNKLFSFKNAGFLRRLGHRPKVRGVAKNPIDHPHGGGEGRSSGGRGSKSQVNRWSKVAKGKPTRFVSNINVLFVYLSRKDKSIRRKKK